LSVFENPDWCNRFFKASTSSKLCPYIFYAIRTQRIVVF
jgi:hypothetical protein